MVGANKPKPRLLIIPNTIATFGGGEHLAFDIANMVKQRFKVTFVNPESKIDLIRADKKGILKQYGVREADVYDVRCVGLNAKAFGVEDYILMVPTPAGIASLARAIKNSDVIYCISNNPFILAYSAFFANRYGSKFVFGVQNRIFASFFGHFEGKERIRDKVGVALYRLALGQVPCYHVLNSFDEKLVRDNFPRAKPYLVPGFTIVDDNRPRSNPEFTVMFAGRLTKYEKGIDLLCEIIEKTLKRNREIKFRIAGAGGDGEPLVKAIAKRHPRNVNWLGFLTYKKVKENWKGSDLALFLSRGEELRYFPLVFLESQSFGLPMITFNGKGFDSVIIDRLQGVMVEPFDTDAVVRNILAYHTEFKKSRSAYLGVKMKRAELNRKLYGDKVIIPKMVKMFTDGLDKK
ncbi:MAG TPA: glycosyltransferase family 4 protein [Candidatus Baltobacteraceae bacterium]|nr:glycosyltransferase family 4 protein [Candidatus Baltobacteraceae bacterium]